MKNKLICFSLLLLFCFLLTPCCFGFDPGRLEGFVVEIQGENNLFPIDITFEDLDKALSGVGKIPAEVYYRTNICLSLPLWQGESTALGVAYRRKANCQITGETLDFYRCLADNADQSEQIHYDLRGDYLEYTQLGGYIAKRWSLDSLLVILRGDLFKCDDFYQLRLLGRGRVKYQLDGSKKYELYGDVQRDWSDSNSPSGLGMALSSDFYYEQSGFSLYLALRNLLGRLYFPELRHDNDSINTKEASIGPLPVSGFTAVGSFYLNIPIVTELQAAYTFDSGGTLLVNYISEGESRSYSLGCRQPFGKIALITAFNPSVKSLDFGLGMDYGKLVLSFGADTMALKGVNLVLRIPGI